MSDTSTGQHRTTVDISGRRRMDSCFHANERSRRIRRTAVVCRSDVSSWRALLAWRQHWALPRSSQSAWGRVNCSAVGWLSTVPMRDGVPAWWRVGFHASPSGFAASTDQIDPTIAGKSLMLASARAGAWMPGLGNLVFECGSPERNG